VITHSNVDCGCGVTQHKKEFFMKSFIKIFVIIAVVAVIGFSVVGCGGDDKGGGHWKQVDRNMDK